MTSPKSALSDSKDARRRRRLMSLVSLAIGVLLACLLVEILVRVVNPMGISYYPETAHYMDTLLLADGVGYRNRPNLQGTFWGVPVAINSLGLRDREILFEKPPNEFRVLIMGDSWPFGIAVRREETFCHLLEEMMKRDAKPGVSVRTVDMGVPSYNTEAELAQFQSLGSKLHPDLVVLMFALNDIEPKMWVFNKRRNWFVNMAQRSYAASFLFVSLRNFRNKIESGKSANVQTGSIDATSMFSGYSAGSPRWLAIDSSMSELNRECRAMDSPFTVFSEAGPKTAAGTLLAALADREHFPLTPLHTYMDPRWAKDRIKLQNSLLDGHPSALGNRAIATLVYEHLQRQGLLSPILRTNESGQSER
jgi:lysophospholipase L1-like esterase